MARIRADLLAETGDGDEVWSAIEGEQDEIDHDLDEEESRRWYLRPGCLAPPVALLVGGLLGAWLAARAGFSTLATVGAGVAGMLSLVVLVPILLLCLMVATALRFQLSVRRSIRAAEKAGERFQSRDAFLRTLDPDSIASARLAISTWDQLTLELGLQKRPRSFRPTIERLYLPNAPGTGRVLADLASSQERVATLRARAGRALARRHRPERPDQRRAQARGRTVAREAARSPQDPVDVAGQSSSAMVTVSEIGSPSR